MSIVLNIKVMRKPTDGPCVVDTCPFVLSVYESNVVMPLVVIAAMIKLIHHAPNLMPVVADALDVVRAKACIPWPACWVGCVAGRCSCFVGMLDVVAMGC